MQNPTHECKLFSETRNISFTNLAVQDDLKYAPILPAGGLIQQLLFCLKRSHNVHLCITFGNCGNRLLGSSWPLMRVTSGNSNLPLSIADCAYFTSRACHPRS